MPATRPAGSEAEIAFISGVTSSATVAGISWTAWKSDKPATYGVTTSSGATNQSFAFKWGSPTLAPDGTAGGEVKYWFDPASSWTTAEQNGLLSGLHMWSAVANITFSAATSATDAGIIFTRNSGGVAVTTGSVFTATIGSDTDGSKVGSDGTILPATISIDTAASAFGPIGDPSAASSFSAGQGYAYNTIIHEIGHALGLGHGGPYNNGDGLGAVPPRQFSVYDMRLWSIMSYIDPDDATAALRGSYPITDTNWILTPPGSGAGTEYFGTTPMILDILAIQRVYGEATTGPLTGDNHVFGFNSNIAGDVGDYYNFNINQIPIVTIWAKGGNNTIDLSGFAEHSELNLNFNNFSSAHGLVNNIAVAPDTQIKTGITGAGDDIIIGNNSSNTLIGNGGNDTLYGNFGLDEMNGGAGNDSFVGGEGGDVLRGGDDNDTAYYTDSLPALVGSDLIGVTVDLAYFGEGAGRGFGGTAELDFLLSIENVVGSPWKDILFGDGGANTLRGFDGDDALVGRGGSDFLDGGNGIDIAAYDQSPSLVEVSLWLGIGVGGDAQGDSFVDIENVGGSQFDDLLIGDDKANQLNGFFGNDTLEGRGGADILFGDVGIDTADYSHNPGPVGVSVRLDTGDGLFGDAHGDRLIQIENVTGSDFDDELIGDFQDNVLKGGGGRDDIYGGEGANTIDGGDGNIDFVHYDFGLDAASLVHGVIVNLELGFGAHGTGTPGEIDTILNVENVIGTPYHDILVGDGHDNLLLGFDGDDELIGGGGDDSIHTGAGTNLALGGPGNDGMNGAEGISDTAYYSGLRSQYTFTGDFNNLVVQDNVADRDGRDVVAYFEFFQFADGLVPFSALTITNAAPTVALSNTVTSTAENGGAIKVADIAITDDGSGINSVTLSGADATSFSISLNQLFFNGGANFEAKSFYDVTVNVDDTTVGGTPDSSASLHLNIINVNEAPTGVGFINATASIPENTPTFSGFKVATIFPNDDALGTNTFTLLGTDAGFFEIAGTELRLKAGLLDFETKSSYAVQVAADDTTAANHVGSGHDATSEVFTVTVTNQNDIPTGVLLNNPVTSTPENGGPIKVADIQIVDDSLGTNTITLSGANATSFSISGTQLLFNGGANFEIKNFYDVTVNVDDASVGDAPDASTNFHLAITNINDAPVNTVPVTQATNEDVAKAITGLSISDVDAGAGGMSVTLAVTHGVLNVSGGTATIANSGTATVTLTGTLAAINSTLAATVSFVPAADYNGSATLTMTSNDGGNTGPDGAKTDTDVVTINIAAVPDIVGDSVTVLQSSGANNLNLLANDSFESPTRAITAVGAAAHGTVAINNNGTPANAADDFVVYTPTAGYSGSDSFSYTVTSGGVLETATVAVTVTALTGGPGSDSIAGGPGNETLNGLGGNDVLEGRGGNDTVLGGTGNDLILYNVGDGNDITDGGAGIDSLVITGAAGNDTVHVKASGGTLTGLEGGTITGVELVLLNLDGGTDTLSYEGTTTNVSVNLSLLSATGFSLITGVENVTGGSGNDSLTGSSVANVLDGGGGNDTLNGLGGNDTLIGGIGTDTLLGGDGGDLFIGGAGVDTIDVGPANDNAQDIVRFSAVSEFGDRVSDFDVTGTSTQIDKVQFTGALNTAYDDIVDNNVFTCAVGNGANGGNTTANIHNTAEGLFLAGTNSEGVATGSLGDAAAVAAEFNAEFAITASLGDDAVLVINDTTANSNSSAVWQYVENGTTAEIQTNELTLIGIFSANAAIATGNLDLA